MGRLKEINLYQRCRETDVHRTKPGTVVWKAMPFVLLIALLLGVWLYLSAQNRALEKELRQTDEAITSQTLLQDVSRARALETYLLELTGETERTEKLLTAIRSYPVVTSGVLRTLQECSRQIVRLDIRSFEAKTGILRLTPLRALWRRFRAISAVWRIRTFLNRFFIPAISMSKKKMSIIFRWSAACCKTMRRRGNEFSGDCAR
ncbi:MAG: hypothetical protein KIG74_04615 [Clostridiaceae bacterium]|nr:hypothetical protein [Clostridiaceae bacterium]